VKTTLIKTGKMLLLKHTLLTEQTTMQLGVCRPNNNYYCHVNNHYEKTRMWNISNYRWSYSTTALYNVLLLL